MSAARDDVIRKASEALYANNDIAQMTLGPWETISDEMKVAVGESVVTVLNSIKVADLIAFKDG